ncbi:hypothetical protein ABB37_02190 [Leptomonas pyrrhocoris]|uniref:Uncharacterized protein n=1 Tax=Leptomonas pyrrhocoris TaxID=157538 RepID=A0A0N0VH13_LEPPY|nr:hypothetical protein ABB37_02190 [Leptomonas pyrrhocoris]XP_015662523.1 hypothetical protein ABB37_02190 [Leptomonas pyrrhocoris]KPA84083.1 hypothetical protein ABB37_02190 [Leptomonas pyrrhocoris]KPA84084.1 hypothetical protein ABB37_02190 [Leptomonas pyrrhocoris]|eukprot:XP_015662522.1 hypothetical protein ABB37_02190 [Leptomonas pyrrhocoris]
MSNPIDEQVFAAALSNEYQWRNLYLKEFGCCTYAPPIPKDPTTTADGIYPLRRQVAQLAQPFSESDSDDFSDGDEEHRASLSLMSPNATGKDASFQSGSPNGSSGTHTRGTVGDQFFLLDLFTRRSSTTPQQQQQQQQRGSSKRSNGSRRPIRGAALRKDDFFDVNDAFSTKFFGFLWKHEDDDFDGVAGDSDDGEAGELDGNPNTGPLGGTSGSSRIADDTLNSNGNALLASRRRRALPQSSALDSTGHDPHNASGRLTLGRYPFLASMPRTDFNDNPHGVHDAIVRLHHETWTMLMDNRLMAWLHRQTVDHYQSATQLRQRLLDVVARGPSFVSASAFATPTASPKRGVSIENSSFAFSSSPARTQEEALQCTLESFSPFFVVIAPAAAVQRAKDQFQAARRAQLRGGSRAAKTAPADMVGLPLYSQYGTWREAYEHRQRWSTAPFSFFLLHDHSYNYAQVTAIFVQMHLLYVHAHTHTRLCAQTKAESMSLQDASQLLTTARNMSRVVELQRSMCPLTAMQEMTENIILAFEQSSSRATLTMLRRVLDFLTDTALDVVTAYRFISREALLRQSGFDLPGMEVQNAGAPAASSTPRSTAATTPFDSKETTQKNLHDTDDDDGVASTNAELDGPNNDETRFTGSTGTGQSRTAQEDDGQRLFKQDELVTSALSPAAIPAGFLEPQRVTEKDVNDLFELVYWFVDTATANTNVPVDQELLCPTFSVDEGNVSAGNVAGADGKGTRSPPPASSAQRPSTILQRPASPSPSPSEGRYLPGKEPLYNAVASFVEAVELLEAHRKPLWMQRSSLVRGQSQSQNKKAHLVAFPRADSSRTSLSATATASASPMLSADSFTGLATPLVVLTTYLRLHGGQWLKQLCNRVFDTLRKQSVLLYVNTIDLDAMWGRLQDPAPSSAEERRASTAATTLPAAGRAAAAAAAAATNSNTSTATPSPPPGRGRGNARRLPRTSFTVPAAAVAASSSSPAPRVDTGSDMEAARQEFLEGLGHFEAVICQDILYAITEFFEALHGKRSAGRLPHGISVLLTQFVTTVHLFLLEGSGSGGVGAGVFSTGGANDTRQHHGYRSSGVPAAGGYGTGKKPTGPQGGNRTSTTDVSPVRQVEERLRVCKQRYHANLRRRQADSTDPFRSVTSANSAGGSGNRQAQQKAERASPAAAAVSLKRLIQTIEHHRLAKFILFDCWILPALNNAVALGYLAPDSPLHLRWNVDALARYLKVLLHAPFVEQDRMSFSSLAAQAPRRLSNSSKPTDSSGGGGGKQKASSYSRASRRKASKSADSRVRPTNVLTLPPYLTGIYDVATGALVRLKAMASPPTTPALADTSLKFLPRSSVVGRQARLSSKLSLDAPEPLSAGGGRPSFVLHRGDAADLVGSDDRLPGWGQPRQPVFEAFPADTNRDVAFKEPPISPLNPFAGGPPQLAAGAPLTFSDVAEAPVCDGDGGRVGSAPTERQTLPPIAATAGGRVGSGGSKSGGRPAEFTAAGDGEALQSPVRRPRSLSRLNQRVASISFVGNMRADSLPSVASGSGVGEDPVVAALAQQQQHPYVVVSDAGWLDISPVMQFLNEELGLTCSDPEGERDMEGSGRDSNIGGASETSSKARAAATMATGLRLPSVEGNSFTSAAVQQAITEGLSAVQALNLFCKVTAADESENVVVAEFDVLPTMAAGCIEKLYDVVTGTHPMVARALQTGAFNFTRRDGHTTPPGATGFSSLFSACLNGVLLHPRTASHVMQNIFENSPAFGQVLMRPVAEGTALELLSSLVSRQGETPMVDVNSIVPLLQMNPSSAPPLKGAIGISNNGIVGGGGGALLLRNGGSNAPAMTTGNALTATITTTTTIAAATAALAHHWENESRRLLRQFTFLTNGFADSQRPVPLVPGIRRPVGPAHPIHMIRAGAERITVDMEAAAVPIVFDPWWRAMVVALSVKAANMFDECREDHTAAFLNTVHESVEAAKHTHRQATTHFIVTKGKAIDEKGGEGVVDVKHTSANAARRTRINVTASFRRGRDTRRSKGNVASSTRSRKKSVVRRPLKPNSAASTSRAAAS